MPAIRILLQRTSVNIGIADTSNWGHASHCTMQMNKPPVNTEVLWECAGYGQGPRWAMTSLVYIRTLMTDQPPNQDPRAAKPGPEEPTRCDSEAMLGGKPPQDPLIGTKVDQYSIKRVIGEGGMGVVYEALQHSPRRIVALKMMKRGVTSKSAMRRFEYEAQTLGRLRHDGIAQIYQAGTWDDGTGGRPWFAMEYIQGAKTLTQYCKDKKLGTRERLELFSNVCEAVQHGHQKGIIHRDLKPPNILVTSSGVPKVIDFGVARSTDSDLAVTTLQTDVGALIGTLQYMSPEQCDADPNDIDIRSDVYAMGVVLYELLCDQLPYALRHAAIHEAARIIREEEPRKPSSLDKRLRGDIETIAMKALEKDRDRRYQSATALEEDIDRYLAGDPIAAKAPSAIDYLKRFARKHKAVAASIAAVFIVLVGAVIAISIFAVEANTQRRIANDATDEILSIMTELKVDPRILDEFVGVYVFDTGTEFTFERPGHELKGNIERQAPLSIREIAQDRFLFLTGNVVAQLTFGRNRRGEIDRVVLHQDGLHQEVLKRGHSPQVVDLGEYTGDYGPSSRAIPVKREGKGLSIKWFGQDWISYVPVGRDRFENKAAKAQFSFLRDFDGRVDRFILHQQQKHREYRKQP
jgi:serine/threonine protein kinase